MDFKDNILQLAERIKKQKDAIQTEEATKNAFIMPIITALGYDVFNPFEVVPEMDCDLTRKGDKIDYAIKKDASTVSRTLTCTTPSFQNTMLRPTHALGCLQTVSSIGFMRILTRRTSWTRNLSWW